MGISPAILAAIRFIDSLKAGEAVTLTADGRQNLMHVSRTAHRSDGAYGSVVSTRVTVTYGPGRYSTEVGAEAMASGHLTLTRGHAVGVSS